MKATMIIQQLDSLQNLIHPNIILTKEKFITKNKTTGQEKLCVIMEYAEGGNMFKVINEKKKLFDKKNP